MILSPPPPPCFYKQHPSPIFQDPGSNESSLSLLSTDTQRVPYAAHIICSHMPTTYRAGVKIQGWGVECAVFYTVHYTAVIRNFIFVPWGIEAGEFFQNCVLLKEIQFETWKKKKNPLSTGIWGEIAWLMVILSVLSMVKLAELKTVKDSLYKDNFIKLKMVWKRIGGNEGKPLYGGIFRYAHFYCEFMWS